MLCGDLLIVSQAIKRIEFMCRRFVSLLVLRKFNNNFCFSSGCQTCSKKDDLPFSGVIYTADENLFNRTVGEEHERKEINKFLQIMNALYNQGSGAVIVHTDEPHRLNMFDEKVDNKLHNMITDQSCFTDCFERFHYDNKHIVFRVKPKYRRLSTLVPNTKISLDHGIVDPSQAQLQYLNKTASREQDDTNANEVELILEQDKEVLVKLKSGLVAFQESRNLQAKQFPKRTIKLLKDESKTTEERIRQLANDCVEGGRLCEYVSAFSKLDGGGSVYLGLEEKKINGVKRWRRAENEEYKGVFTVHDPEFSAWKDGSVYCVAREEDVPVQNEVRTGEFICQGISLNSDEQLLLSRYIEEKIKTDMRFCRFTSHVPFQVKFLDIQGTSDHYVVQVKVEKYHCLSFYKPEGPLSYELSSRKRLQTTDPLPVRSITAEKWLKCVH